jgi:hypothetical protein
MAKNGTAGYVAGGYSSSYLASIDKLAFSNDTRSTLSATLSSNKGDLAAMANSL